MNATLVLGIDVSQKKLHATLLDRQDVDHPRWQTEVANHRLGIKQLLQRTPADAVLVVEPTGSFSELLVRQAREAGRKVLMASPRKARYYLRSRPERGKTDRLDSRGLAEYGANCRLPEYPLKEAATKRVEQLLAARRGLSESIKKLTSQARSMPFAQEHLAPAIAGLKAQLKALDRTLQQAVREDCELAEPVARLQTVPGFGLVCATTFGACLQAKPFARADAFVAYCGLDVTVSQSGRRKAPGSISHEGHAELRRLLYVAAMSAVRAKGSPFKPEYERLQAAGRKKTEALCIIARKLARLAWSIVRHGTSYEPERVYAPRT